MFNNRQRGQRTKTLYVRSEACVEPKNDATAAVQGGSEGHRTSEAGRICWHFEEDVTPTQVKFPLR